MRHKKTLIGAALIGIGLLAGCHNLYRNLEVPYMRPGALDKGITTNLDVYKFKFIDRYRVTHAWPVTSNCHYSKLPTKYTRSSAGYSEVKIVDDIYEDEKGIWQRDTPPKNISSYVRSKIVHQPIFENVNGGRAIVRYEDQEQGLQAMCFQAWVGTSHTLILRLHKLDMETWKTLWSRYNPSGKWTQQQINGAFWATLENDEKDMQRTGTGGWFKSYLTPIADTGYSISIQLGANQDSLQNPQAHAAMQLLFRQLLESVKVEHLTPSIEAELAELKAKAQDIQRQECVESSKKGKPGPWCKIYGFH
jgi:hypothetical protein